MFEMNDEGRAKLFSLRNQGVMLACWLIMSAQLALLNQGFKAITGSLFQDTVTLLNTENDYD